MNRDEYEYEYEYVYVSNINAVMNKTLAQDIIRPLVVSLFI